MADPRTAHAFPPSARLHTPAQFAPALKGRRVARGDCLVLTTPHSSENRNENTSEAQATQARLGMVIAKRYAKRAVTRNAIKRVLREAFRAQQMLLLPRDYVFRLHSRIPPQSLTRLKVTVRSQADALLHHARRVP